MGSANKPISITSEEINALIYAYLQDSGLQHTAYLLRSESKLDAAPCFSTHIPRGELIELLSKALLYVEVEHHWQRTPETKNCKNGFSLLQKHSCTAAAQRKQKEETRKHTPMEVDKPDPPKKALAEKLAAKDKVGQGTKRKAETPTEELEDNEKRQKRESSTKDSAPTTAASSGQQSSAISNIATDPAKKIKQKLRQGALDEATDPRATLMLSGHAAEVFVCAFNPHDTSLLASGAKDGTVLIWRLFDSPSDGFAPKPADPIRVESFKKADQGDLTSLSWSPDGKLLAVGSYDKVFRIITVEGELYFSHAQHEGPIFVVRFSKNGRYVLSASLDGSIGLWDVPNKCLVRQYYTHQDACLDVVWISNEYFASCGADATAHILSVNGRTVTKVLSGHKTEINQIKVNRSGTKLASCSDDKTTRIWDISRLKGLSPLGGDAIPGLSSFYSSVLLGGHEKSVSTIAWQPVSLEGEDEILATSSFDGTARMWNSITGKCLATFSDHKRPVYALNFSPDGRFLASGSGDGYLHIYGVQERQKLWSWHAGNVKPGVFEIEWQMREGHFNRIAVALECKMVGLIDVTKIPALQYE